MRRNLRSIVAAIPALLVMACALGPDYHRPETKVPAAFRFEPTPTTESFADQGWWQVYQDPTLQSLIREALDNNLDVRIAAARIEQARAVLGSTRLQQLPQIAVSADAQRARTSVDQRVPGVPAISNVFSADGSLSYELDFWGKYRRATESARAGLLASAYAKQDVMAGLVSGVATAYFTLLTLDEQLAITQRTVGTRQKFVDLTQAQHERGTVSGLDVATAQAQLAIAQANIPDLQRQIGIAEDQLSVLLDRNPDQIVRTESSQLRRMIEPAIPPVPPAGLPSSLLERRPDLRAAEQNLVAANANVGVAKANLFPSITLTAAGGSESSAMSDLFRGSTRTWSVGAGLLQPLLSPQRSLFELADAQKRQALLQYQQSIQVAFREVSDALIARQKYAEFQVAEQAQVDAQRRANTIALARYRVGSASYFDVINADRDLFTAELSLSAAHLNTLLSLVQLYRAVGGGWQTEQSGKSAPDPTPDTTGLTPDSPSASARAP
ncbi:MAG: efflux transporter outer membrane subunit [Gammaproteobacteria bacterium]|nr:MAG: efflux transporter outer membrane subunit [Gammaproteobacteria bacterium]